MTEPTAAVRKSNPVASPLSPSQQTREMEKDSFLTGMFGSKKQEIASPSKSGKPPPKLNSDGTLVEFNSPKKGL